MGMYWQDSLFVDTALPFGLRSAPKIFTSLADAAQWILNQAGINFVVHYLDDFLLVGPLQSSACAKALESLLATFHRLGLPIAENKLEGPTTQLVFLGFEIDTTALEVRLPHTKLSNLQSTVVSWLNKKSCTKKQSRAA